MKDESLSEEEILEALLSLEEKGLINSYEVDGELCYQISMAGASVIQHLNSDPKTRN